MTMKYAKVIGRTLTKNHPYHAQWFLTRRCNYRCKSCDVWREVDSRELSTDHILMGLDNLKRLGITEIVFSGGNPLLRDDIAEILKYAKKRFITTVYDNGSMLINKIHDLKHADFVCVSLDTLDPKKHAKLKGVGEGAWERTLNGIKELHRRYKNVVVSPTISGLNWREIPEIIRYFGELKIPLVFCLYEFGESDSAQFKIGKKSDKLVIERENLVKTLDEILDLKKRYRMLVTDKILNAMKAYFADRKRWECRALDSFVTVDHLGNVSGCHVRSPVANITDDLKALWNSEKFEKRRGQNTRCARCNYLCYAAYSLYSKPRDFLDIKEVSLLRI